MCSIVGNPWIASTVFFLSEGQYLLVIKSASLFSEGDFKETLVSLLFEIILASTWHPRSSAGMKCQGGGDQGIMDLPM